MAPGRLASPPRRPPRSFAGAAGGWATAQGPSGAGNLGAASAFIARCHGERRSLWTTGGIAMRGVLLWLIGVPIPIVILLYLFDVI